LSVPYDPTIYRGSAPHYAFGRPPYSPQLEAILAQALGLDGLGRLLDAGCGPGILALRLAYLFEEVVGLDPDPDMLAEARRRATAQGVANVDWVQARAEDLPGAAPGPYRIVTFGQSRHWTDEEPVVEAVYDLIEPGGAMAMVVHTAEDRTPPPNPGHPPIPTTRSKAWSSATSARPDGPAKASFGSATTPSKTYWFGPDLGHRRPCTRGRGGR